MKKEILLRKLKGYIETIEDTIDNISTLLELDADDDGLAELSVTFREQLENAIGENDECTYSDIQNYIEENL